MAAFEYKKGVYEKGRDFLPGSIVTGQRATIVN